MTGTYTGMERESMTEENSSAMRKDRELAPIFVVVLFQRRSEVR